MSKSSTARRSKSKNINPLARSKRTAPDPKSATDDAHDAVLTRKDEQSPQDKWAAAVDEWTAKIKPKAEKVLECAANLRASIIDLGTELEQAKQELPWFAFKTVVARSGLRSLSNVDNYRRVAKAKHLRNPEFQPHLPMGVGALIDLAAWKEDDVRKCIAAGVLRPDSTRSDLSEWKFSRRKKKDKKDPKRLILSVYAQSDWSDDDQAAMETALGSFAGRIELKRPEPKTETAEEVRQGKIMSHIRSAARVLLKAVQARNKVSIEFMRRKNPLTGKSPARDPEHPGSMAVFDRIQDLSIPHDANEEHVRSILKTIGHGDKYEQLHEEAVAAVEKAPVTLPTDAEVAAEANRVAEDERDRAVLEQRGDPVWPAPKPDKGSRAGPNLNAAFKPNSADDNQ